jgi:hypothetical protein
MSKYNENGQAVAQMHQLRKGTVDAPIQLPHAEQYEPVCCIAKVDADT